MSEAKNIDKNMRQSDPVDIVKIYLWIISALCVITLAWLGYNFFLKKRYESKILEGAGDMLNILEYEKKRPAQKVVPKEIPEPFKFFKRAIDLPDEPEVELFPWEPGNEGGIVFDEKKYIVRFEKGISRRDLGRYVYKIYENAPYLMLKRAEIQRAENAPAHQDRWTGELEFAFRRAKME